MVIIRSSSPTAEPSALSSVVFPEPVDPLTTIERRSRTAWRRSGDEVGRPERVDRHGRRSDRMVRYGPSMASGAMTAFTREPSGRRASTSGRSAVDPQPERARSPDRCSVRSALPASGTGPRATCRALDPDRVRPVDHHFLTSGSARRASSGPSPMISATRRAVSASVTRGGTSGASRRINCRNRSATASRVAGAVSLSVRRSERKASCTRPASRSASAADHGKGGGRDRATQAARRNDRSSDRGSRVLSRPESTARAIAGS